MKDFVYLISKLWKNESSDRYILYIDTHEVAGMPDGLVFGHNLKLLSDASAAQFGIDELPDISECCYPVHKMAILYMGQTDGVKIRIALSSLIYGHSNRHVVGLVQDSSGSWRINMDNHSSRAHDSSRCSCSFFGGIFLAEKTHNYYFDGFSGSLDDCIERIYRMEKESDDPYACMRQDYNGRQMYDTARKTGIELIIKRGGFSI